MEGTKNKMESNRKKAPRRARRYGTGLILTLALALVGACEDHEGTGRYRGGAHRVR